MTFELRDYQSEAIAKVRERLAEGHRPIICAPTGSGKTVIAGHLARQALDDGKRVLFMSGREEILRQTFATFNEICGTGKVGFLMRDQGPWWFYPPVTVASWDTLKARWNKSSTWQIPADVVLIDECHLALSQKMSATILPHYENQTVIGLTATPARRSGKGLGSYFTRIIQVRSVQQIIDDGYLAGCEYWAGSHADISGVRVDAKTNDYAEKDLAKAAMEGKLVGDILDNWLRIARDRHTIVFAVNIAHAQAIAERFQGIGVDAEAIHSKMTPPTRSRISEQFRAGKLQVLVNVGIATYGYDVPSVNCIVLARPTKSIVLHLQMIGRGMRPKPDGGYCVVLDHADNVRRLGAAEDPIRWRLGEGVDAAVNWERHEKNEKRGENALTECGGCGHMFSRSRVCPKCGWEKPARSADIKVVEAELVKVRKSRGDAVLAPQDKARWYLMARGWCLSHGKSEGMAYYRFKDKFGEEPPRGLRHAQALEPDVRVDAYMRAGLIRFAKRRQKERMRA